MLPPQGFLILFTLGALYYYAMLSLYALLSIFNTDTNKFIHNAEPWLHIFVNVISLASPIAALQMELINPNGPWCSIQTLPFGCSTSDDVDCIRGGGHDIMTMAWILGGVPIFTVLAFSATMMCLLVWIVRRREKNIEKCIGKTKFIEQARQRRTKHVARQSMLYLLALYLYLLPSVARIIQLEIGRMHFPTLVIAFIVFPLMGFINLIVYTMSLRWAKKKFVSAHSVKCTNTTEISTVRHPVIPPPKPEPERQTKNYSFSIFDGTNPSDEWREFIISDNESSDEEDVGDFLNEEEGVSSQYSSIEENASDKKECYIVEPNVND
uniref:G-protein coupled receptors family 1 profile domain-containing protein n=1 Tax=Helicotheca tamesis TaxID=374047 RepID=A0A7S2MEU8_9STRA